MEVQWKTITDFPHYAAASDGSVKRIVGTNKSKIGKIIRPCHSGRYDTITLYKDGKPFFLTVHRLICSVFRGFPPSPIHQASHIDGNRKNNSEDNLRWATPKENEADKKRHCTYLSGDKSTARVFINKRPRGIEHGRHTKPEKTARGERCSSKLNEEQIIKIRSDKRPRKEISLEYDISVTMVGYIVRGISWAHVTPIQAKEEAQ